MRMIDILVVGLGNPGRRYEKTRHNLGFRVIDAVAKRRRMTWHKDSFGRSCFFGRVPTDPRLEGYRLYLLKPLTGMNNSGLAIELCMMYHEIDPSNILVICDDLNLPFGTLRLRRWGRDGGHNGLKSIIKALETGYFPRLRVGIGRPPEGMTAIEYVTGPFSEEEEEKLKEVIERAADKVEDFIREETK